MAQVLVNSWAPNKAAVVGALGEAACSESNSQLHAPLDDVPNVEGGVIHVGKLDEVVNELEESEPHARTVPDADDQPVNNDTEIRDSSGEVYEVENIIDERSSGKASEYLIRWKGFDPRFNSWEPKENILDSGLIEEWQKLLQLRHQEAETAKVKAEKAQAKAAARSKRRKLGAEQMAFRASAPSKEGMMEDDPRDPTLVNDLHSFWLPRYVQKHISEGAQLMHSRTLSLYLNNGLGRKQMLETETKLRTWTARQRETAASGKSTLPSPFRRVGLVSTGGRGHGGRRAHSQMQKCIFMEDEDGSDEEESGRDESEGEGEQRIESCIRDMRHGKTRWILMKWQGESLFCCEPFCCKTLFSPWHMFYPKPFSPAGSSVRFQPREVITHHPFRTHPLAAISGNSNAELEPPFPPPFAAYPHAENTWEPKRNIHPEELADFDWMQRLPFVLSELLELPPHCPESLLAAEGLLCDAALSPLLLCHLCTPLTIASLSLLHPLITASLSPAPLSQRHPSHHCNKHDMLRTVPHACLARLAAQSIGRDEPQLPVAPKTPTCRLPCQLSLSYGLLEVKSTRVARLTRRFRCAGRDALLISLTRPRRHPLRTRDWLQSRHGITRSRKLLHIQPVPVPPRLKRLR